MSVRRNGSEVSSLALRMGEARGALGRAMSEATLRSRCGPVLALVAWSGGTPLEVVPLAMVALEDQPQRIAEERARLEARYPECDVEVVS